LIAGASLRSVGRWAGDRQAARVAGRSKGGAGGSARGASRRSIGRRAEGLTRRRESKGRPEGCRKMGRKRKLEINRKPTGESDSR